MQEKFEKYPEAERPSNPVHPLEKIDVPTDHVDVSTDHVDVPWFMPTSPSILLKRPS